MKKIGIDGGHTVYELGPLADVVLFFECLNAYVVNVHVDQDWRLLSDRFYKRYVRQCDLEDSLLLMEKARSIFLNLPGSSVDWDGEMQADRTRIWLNAKDDSLGHIFSRYFDLFAKAKDSAISFSDEFGIYQPLRILVSDMPALIVERNRRLNEYDLLGLSDLPFWRR
jgi:hypothetical protein